MSKMKFNWRGRRGGYDVVVYNGNSESRKNISYNNFIDKDPNRIAQVLLDLETVDSFPIEKAVKIYLSKKKNNDWLGLD